MRTRVDIVGGGISGLASAYFLAQSPLPLNIHVWERDRTPGGLAGSFSTPNFTLEKFYHHLYRRDIALKALIEELDLGSDLEWRTASTGAYYNQRPYRLSSPLDLLRYKPLPFVDRLRLVRLMMHARLHRDWRQLDDMSVREYVTQHAGKTVYDGLWQPLLKGKFGAHADSVSAAWLWAKMVDRGWSRTKGGVELLGYLRGGLSRVFDALVDRLARLGHRVHLGSTVRRFQSDAQNRIGAVVTDEGTFATDFVISGVQLPDLANLLPDQQDAYRSSLRRIEFLANVCLVLVLNRPLSAFYWTNVTDPSCPFIGVIEHTRWARPAEFARKHLVYLSAYVTADDPRLDMDSRTLLDFYLPHVCRMFPDFSTTAIEGDMLWTAQYTQPIVTMGYRHLIPAIRGPVPNLFVCTMAQIYPSDRQVSNGVEMARRVVDAFLSHHRERHAA